MTEIQAGRRITLAIAMAALAAACSDYPRDVEDTTAKLERGAPLRVGIVSGTELSPEAQTALADVAAQVGAPIARGEAPAALLLDRLDKGEIELVIGEFAKQTPLIKDASFSDRIGAPEPDDGTRPVLRFARRHGENRWIMLTDGAARR